MKPEQPLTAQETHAVRHLLTLYRDGWFPMDEEWEEGKAEIRWVQPANRGIIPLDPASFHIPANLRARVRAAKFEITTDTAFAQVIHECSQPDVGRESTWLHPDIIDAFNLLHDAGHAHSIEAWAMHNGSRTLVGGLYGLALGRAFCGESMFSRPTLGGTDASKVALVQLVHHLRRRGFQLLDSQLTNPHLEQFGCHDIPREDYLAMLKPLTAEEVEWTPFEPDRTRGEVSVRTV